MNEFICHLPDIIRRRPNESRKSWLKRKRRLRYHFVGVDYGTSHGDSRAVVRMKVTEDPVTGLNHCLITSLENGDYKENISFL